MIKKLNSVATEDNIIDKINEIIEVLNQYESDRVWTRKEFQEKLKEQLYKDYMSK